MRDLVGHTSRSLVTVIERGRQAGRDPGDNPASRFHSLVDEAVRTALELPQAAVEVASALAAMTGAQQGLGPDLLDLAELDRLAE